MERLGRWGDKLRKKKESFDSLVRGTSGSALPETRKPAARKDVSRAGSQKRSVSPPRTAGTSASHMEASRVTGTPSGAAR